MLFLRMKTNFSLGSSEVRFAEKSARKIKLNKYKIYCTVYIVYKETPKHTLSWLFKYEYP